MSAVPTLVCLEPACQFTCNYPVDMNTHTVGAHGRRASAMERTPCKDEAVLGPNLEGPATVTSIGKQREGSRTASFTCDECGHTAKNAAGLSIHKGRSHGAAKVAPTREPKRVNGHRATDRPERPKLDATTIKADLYDAQDDYDPWLVVVGASDESGPKIETAVVSTKVDAEQVAALLTALGHQPRRFRLADGATGEAP